MQTRLFEWAEGKGISMETLSEMVGYSARQLYRIRNGEYPITEGFVARIALRLGKEGRALFFDGVSENSDIAQEDADAVLQEVPQ